LSDASIGEDDATKITAYELPPLNTIDAPLNTLNTPDLSGSARLQRPCIPACLAAPHAFDRLGALASAA
jgi:hypothetical protein